MSRLKGAELWELWRARVRRFDGLQQTVAEFCQWEGVSTAAFYLWRKKLQAAGPQRQTTAIAKPVDMHQRPLFVPVVSAARSVSASGAVVVMTLSNGTRVELPASDHQLIAYVVTSVASLQGGHQ